MKLDLAVTLDHDCRPRSQNELGNHVNNMSHISDFRPLWAYLVNSERLLDEFIIKAFYRLL